MNSFDQQALTMAAIDLLAFSPDDVWVAQLANGGNASRGQVLAYCTAEAGLSDDARDAVSQAVNELIMDFNLPLRVPYSFDPDPGSVDPAETA